MQSRCDHKSASEVLFTYLHKNKDITRSQGQGARMLPKKQNQQNQTVLEQKMAD